MTHHTEWAKVSVRRDWDQITINIQNTGQTPALEVNVTTQARLVKPEDDALIPPIIDETAPGHNWGAIGNGGTIEIPAVHKDITEMLLDVELNNGRFNIQFYGILRYKTMFNESFDTMFCFHCNEVGAGADLIDGRHVEKPVIMHRSPYILPAYRLHRKDEPEQRA